MIRHRGQRTDPSSSFGADPDDLLFGDELDAVVRDGFATVHTVFTRSGGKADRAAHRRTVLISPTGRPELWSGGFLELLERTFADAIAPATCNIERFALERGASVRSRVGGTFGRSGEVRDRRRRDHPAGGRREQGVLMPFGCRMGICQSCVVSDRQGAVRDLRTGVEHVEGERADLCPCRRRGDCTLDV